METAIKYTAIFSHLARVRLEMPVSLVTNTKMVRREWKWLHQPIHIHLNFTQKSMNCVCG